MRESVSQVGGCCVTERAPTRSFPRIHIHHHMPDDYDEDDDDDDVGMMVKRLHIFILGL